VTRRREMGHPCAVSALTRRLLSMCATYAHCRLHTIPCARARVPGVAVTSRVCPAEVCYTWNIVLLCADPVGAHWYSPSGTLDLQCLPIWLPPRTSVLHRWRICGNTWPRVPHAAVSTDTVMDGSPDTVSHDVIAVIPLYRRVRFLRSCRRSAIVGWRWSPF
jgi:hypothetical protein